VEKGSGQIDDMTMRREGMGGGWMDGVVVG
jgi:hypothetical protein